MSVVTKHCLSTEGGIRWCWEPTTFALPWAGRPAQVHLECGSSPGIPISVEPERWCRSLPALRWAVCCHENHPLHRTHLPCSVSIVLTSPVRFLTRKEPVKLLGGFASQNQGRLKVSVGQAKRIVTALGSGSEEAVKKVPWTGGAMSWVGSKWGGKR